MEEREEEIQRNILSVSYPRGLSEKEKSFELIALIKPNHDETFSSRLLLLKRNKEQDIV